MQTAAQFVEINIILVGLVVYALMGFPPTSSSGSSSGCCCGGGAPSPDHEPGRRRVERRGGVERPPRRCPRSPEHGARLAGDVVRVTNLRRAFGPRVVLDGLDLHIAPGEFVALLGKRVAARPPCSARSVVSTDPTVATSSCRRAGPSSSRSRGCCPGARCGATSPSASGVKRPSGPGAPGALRGRAGRARGQLAGHLFRRRGPAPPARTRPRAASPSSSCSTSRSPRLDALTGSRCTRSSRSSAGSTNPRPSSSPTTSTRRCCSPTGCSCSPTVGSAANGGRHRVSAHEWDPPIRRAARRAARRAWGATRRRASEPQRSVATIKRSW